MTKLVFESGVGLKGLPFGSSPECVRAFFGNGYQSFKRSPESEPADYWPDAGVFAYYDATTSHLEALEFASPSDPVLKGASILTAMLGDAIARLRSLDPELLVEQDGAISAKLGVGVWSATGELDRPAMSTITFRPGYFD